MNANAPSNIALITGASTGIGATYARRLAMRGHDLILVARDGQRMQTLADDLRTQYGVAVEVLPADLTDPAQLARVETRLRADSNIAMLVNNAGMAGGGPLDSAQPDQLQRLLDLNVVALTRLSVAALPTMLAKGRGTIVNLGSVTSLMPETFDTTYGASKAYVLNFSIGLHRQTADKGIRVQVVLPGVTRTEIWDRSGTDLATLPPEMVMEVGDLVDAALAGLDQGEVVTIPSLPDASRWDALTSLRQSLFPDLSHRRPADRYLAKATASS